MRSYWLALAGLLVGTGLHAQQPATPPTGPAPTSPPATTTPPAAAAPNAARLDALLGRWESEMKNVQTLGAELKRTARDKVYGKDEIFVGSAKYMKPNRAMLEMHKDGNPAVFEKYLCSGTLLYEWVPASKVVRVHELPAPKAGQVAEDNFLSFLFGMKAEEARRRYEMKLVQEDKWWVYIEVLPRFPADKADFQKARLILNANNFLPRQVWFEQPNGNEITWDIPKIENGGTAVRATDFAPPVSLPQGWNMVKVPRATAPKKDDTPPRVVRPQQ
jgi:TIGR03009 family protein